MQLSESDTKRMNKVLRHRLRNLASGIQSAVKLLSKEAEGRLKPREMEYFPLILGECEQVSLLTDRFSLLFDDVPPGSESKAADVVDSAVRRVRTESPTRAVAVSCETGAAAAAVRAGRLAETALVEVLRNAVEASPSSEVRVGCSLCGDALCFVVEDGGKGVADGELEQMFLPFYTTRPRHLGVGLTIARRLIRMLEGDIEAEAGHPGLRVRIRLPARTAGQDASALSTATPPRGDVASR